jgi:transposase
VFAGKGFGMYIYIMGSTEMVYIPKAEYEELKSFKAEVALLKYQLSELKRLIFGAKSERFISPIPGQLNLFELPAELPIEKPQEEITYTRTVPQKEKKHPLRAEIPAHLPRRIEVIEPENIPEGSKKIGEAITEILEYESANIYVRQIVRPKYIIESNDEATRIAIAELPSLPIPKGNAGPSMLAHVLVNKFVDHLPFYRQSQIFKRQGLYIAESTIGGWFSASCNLLDFVYQKQKTMILSSNYLMADETPIAVLTSDKPGATHKGYYWVYYDPVNRLVLFDYRKTRGREGPEELLKNFSGHLQTDGYTAYNNLKNQSNITQLACMAHARRKFEHAKDNDSERATWAMSMIQKLYDIERLAREESLLPEEITQLRLEQAKPVLDEMGKWLKEQINLTLPKSAIGGAIAYTLTLWPRLIRYIDDGRFQIDNNLIENSIRPVALGRKNYLFAGSHEAAQNAAVIYSLLATCKINDVEPLAWLTQTLATISDYPANQLHKLLPGQR